MKRELYIIVLCLLLVILIFSLIKLDKHFVLKRYSSASIHCQECRYDEATDMQDRRIGSGYQKIECDDDPIIQIKPVRDCEIDKWGDKKCDWFNANKIVVDCLEKENARR